MLIKRLPFAVLAGILLAAILPVFAQDPTYLSLQSPTTELQTGQEYIISIRVDNVPELWMASVEMIYDPDAIYVMGTQSGSPVTLGSFWTPDLSIPIRNSAQQGLLSYTASQLSPAELLSGSGVIGTFRIYPLASGKTTLRIYQAQLTTVTFSGEGEQRIGTDPRPVAFVPALLELNVTGSAVERPAEPTATPQPTETSTLVFIPTSQSQPATLANITLPPGGLPTSIPATPPESNGSDKGGGASGIIFLAGIAVLLMAIIITGLLIRRSR